MSMVHDSVSTRTINVSLNLEGTHQYLPFCDHAEDVGDDSVARSKRRAWVELEGEAGLCKSLRQSENSKVAGGLFRGVVEALLC